MLRWSKKISRIFERSTRRVFLPGHREAVSNCNTYQASRHLSACRGRASPLISLKNPSERSISYESVIAAKQEGECPPQ